MAQLEVLTIPDKRLRNKAKRVGHFDASLQKIVDDMFETMYAEEGIGLAAIQVNIPQAIVVIDLGEDNPFCLINPETISQSGECTNEEGCLSVPDYVAKVKRAEKVLVRANKLDGSEWEISAEGLLAVCIQHEMDHLQGKLFIDHLSPLKREMALRQAKKSKHKNSFSSSKKTVHNAQNTF